ncbi:hypothetical protein CFC21_101173 [Triticum aestivum]|uniref:PDZ domain-containing protein n=2 Tax=Triticum aestivum TaxID=4565 RepID=A0A9R1N3R6_WHEAT|nr:uncharacterized protein LOC123157892 [Triticum aestivum]KAF7099550.1 hypothetical protein CFC21_101173 [Triticum aestivum]
MEANQTPRSMPMVPTMRPRLPWRVHHRDGGALLAGLANQTLRSSVMAPTTREEVSGSMEAQPEAAPPSQRGKRKKTSADSSPAASQPGKSEALEPSESERRKRTHKSDDEKKATTSKGEQAASASPSALDASSSSSSTVSSPLRRPHSPACLREFTHDEGPEVVAAIEAYEELESKYLAKLKRQQELVTLDPSMPYSCMVNADLQRVRESATKTVLQVAKVILRFSSFIDGKLMAQSSGFLIDWDEGTKEGTVLTSARIICSKYTVRSQWSGTDEYAPNAEVVAYLLDQDDTTVPAHLLQYDKHINIALFKVDIDLCAKIPTFNNEVFYGQDIFVLGRDEDLNLTVHHGCVQFMGPTTYERHHHLFTGCVIKQASIGGPVIDFNGQVLGMANFPGTAFIPCSIILKCLDMWKKFQCIPRLHIGMKLSAIKYLDPIRAEKIFRKCNVDSGLIVIEVSHGSIAEELGVRPGDIIYSMNGECIATTVELENLIMRICGTYLEQGGAIGSCMDIPVGILHMRKGRKGPSRTLSLILNVSDDVEVFKSDMDF